MDCPRKETESKQAFICWHLTGKFCLSVCLCDKSLAFAPIGCVCVSPLSNLSPVVALFYRQITSFEIQPLCRNNGNCWVWSIQTQHWFQGDDATTVSGPHLLYQPVHKGKVTWGERKSQGRDTFWHVKCCFALQACVLKTAAATGSIAQGNLPYLVCAWPLSHMDVRRALKYLVTFGLYWYI